MKKLLIVICTLILVSVFSVTGVFATDLSSYFSKSSFDGFEPTFFYNGFLSNSGSGTRQYSVMPSQNILSMSGSVTFDLEVGMSTDKMLWFSGNSYIVDCTVTNLVGCTLSQNGRVVYPASNSVTHGSFDFSVTYSTATNFPQFYSGIQDHPVAWTFDTLTYNNVDLISSVVQESIPVSLSPGYALIVEGACSITSRNFSISNSWDFVQLSQSQYRVNASMERVLGVNNIVSGFSPDKNRARTDMVQWTALNPNASGKASSYSFTGSDIISVSSGSCYVLTYPQYFGIQGISDQTFVYENSVDLNGTLNIEYTGTRPVIRKVAIETVEEWVNREYQMYNVFRPDIYDEAGTLSSDGGNTSVSFPDSPSGGGNTGQPSLTDDDTSLLAVLQRFINQITGLFTTAINAIQTLISDGSSFMQSIGTMFTWLPAPVLAVITSVFTIMLTIGVVKLLWK